MTQKPDWWGWVELEKPVYEPMRLKDNAPDEVKKKFEEWQKQKKEERSQRIYK
jgi:hypothetical protein